MNFFCTTDTTDTTIWKPGLTILNITRDMPMYSDQHCYYKNISTGDLVLNFCSQGKEISTKLNRGAGMAQW